MKTSSILRIAVLAMPLILASCGSKKKVVEQQAAEKTVKTVTTTGASMEFLKNVNENVQSSRFFTSKVKFTVEVGDQNITLTGNLRMKRDDVIRMQLMAFGFVEAARLEFTKDYVLIMDRINKQYIMQPYVQVDFLRNSGINFYTLQALFWNELFIPNRPSVTTEDLQKFTTHLDSGDGIILYEDDKMTYSWLADERLARINMANILYKDRLNGNSQLNWDYQDFQLLDEDVNNKVFPTLMNISLNTPKNKEVKLRMKLSYVGEETGWEEHTQVSSKYREVSIDEMLKRFMAL